MADTAAQRLRDVLASELSALPPGPIAVAYSGGLDSTVLLHALCGIADARKRGLRAIHVDHGLQALSPDWAEQCAANCTGFAVALSVLRTQVAATSGMGVEAAARRARFAALQSALAEDEILAFAHHRDDQAETVLLKLLRGAGPEGLGGMRRLRRIGRLRAWRPLLGVPHSLLFSYAQQCKLKWSTDPSNADPLIDRNYLRLDVFPRLRRRWPEADSSITQSAGWIQAAAEFIESQAASALAGVLGPSANTLRYREWLELPEALRDPVLRRWLRSIDMAEPNQWQVAELVRQLAEAGEDKLPCIRWPGAELRRYRELVHALPPLHLPAPDWQQGWDGTPLVLPADLGSLGLVDDDGVARPLDAGTQLYVRFRRGGEGLRMVAGGQRRELRDLFQEAGIPPWERGRIPMIFDNHGELILVGDLWTAESGRAFLSDVGRQLVWSRAH
jgi:tRNA(Ile)-lysidine synthase